MALIHKLSQNSDGGRVDLMKTFKLAKTVLGKLSRQPLLVKYMTEKLSKDSGYNYREDPLFTRLAPDISADRLEKVNALLSAAYRQVNSSQTR